MFAYDCSSTLVYPTVYPAGISQLPLQIHHLGDPAIQHRRCTQSNNTTHPCVRKRIPFRHLRQNAIHDAPPRRTSRRGFLMLFFGVIFSFFGHHELAAVWPGGPGDVQVTLSIVSALFVMSCCSSGYGHARLFVSDQASCRRSDSWRQGVPHA
jgi:hypothetical protein